jgi:DNA-directed RNA polymerase specialized sigma24 family protein
MADDAKAKARRAVRRAQSEFEREQGKAHEKRRSAFAKAQEANLSLRDISEEVGLHRSRISQIIRGR